MRDVALAFGGVVVPGGSLERVFGCRRPAGLY